MATTKESPISICVQLDENKIPESIRWSAPDGGVTDEEAKAMLLSFWDGAQQETLRMDLWVKEMPLDQMQHFFHQSLLTLCDTYQRATADEPMANALRDFCAFYAKERKLKTS